MTFSMAAGMDLLDLVGKYRHARALIYGIDGVRRDAKRGSMLLRDVLQTTAKRRLTEPVYAADSFSSRERINVIATAPCEQIFDVQIHIITCLSCQTDNSINPAMLMEGHAKYSDMFELAQEAVFFAETYATDRVNQCRSCGAPCVSFVDFHSFQRNLDCDLVIRCMNLKITPYRQFQILWMDKKGQYRLATEVEAPLKDTLRPETLAMAAQMCLRNADLTGAAAKLKQGLQLFPTSKAFLSLAHMLIETSKIGLAEAIAEQYIQSYVEQPEGYACLAHIYIKGFTASGQTEMDLLDQAESLADQSLRFGACREASLAKLKCLSLRRLEPQVVAPLYDDLLQLYPDHANAFRDYGLFILEHDPRKALSLFEHGAGLAPGDVDFLVGQARALARLNRLADVGTRLSVARAISPQHPSVVDMLKTYAAFQ